MLSSCISNRVPAVRNVTEPTRVCGEVGEGHFQEKTKCVTRRGFVQGEDVVGHFNNTTVVGRFKRTTKCVTRRGSVQGEDVVAGIRTPEPIERLSETLPQAYAQLIKNCDLLEAHYKDMQVGGVCTVVFVS